MPLKKSMKFMVVPFEDGFRVMSSDGAFFSNKPLSLKMAKRQQRALYAKAKQGHIYSGGCYTCMYHEGEPHIILQGEGFLGDIFAKVKQTANSAVRFGKTIFDRVGSVAKGLRNDYPPKVRDTLAQYGDGKITSLLIRREPIKGYINLALNLVTQGKWDEARSQMPFDKLYHLSMVATVVMPNETVVPIVIEKNQVINISTNVPRSTKMEYINIPVDYPLTLNELMDKAQKTVGNDFFKYDAFTNNCQMFINTILKANDLDNPQIQAFVLQPVDGLLQKLPEFTSPLARTVTNIAGLADVAMFGDGKDIVMKPKDFFKEHKNLVKLLTEISTKLMNEAQEQSSESKQWKKKLKGGVIDKTTYEKRQARGLYPKDQTYEQFVGKEEAVAKQAQAQLADVADYNKRYAQFVQANPEQEDVRCNLDENLEPVRGRFEVVPRYICDERHRQRYEKQQEKSPFHHIMKGIQTVGDVITTALPVPAPLKYSWKALKEISGQKSYLDGSGKVPKDKFMLQLKEVGMTPQVYLRHARRFAKKYGYNPKNVMFADNNKNKLMILTDDGRKMRFGSVGNGDFILHTFENKDKGLKERQKYLARATKIKGNWRDDKFSANNLALKILWNE